MKATLTWRARRSSVLQSPPGSQLLPISLKTGGWNHTDTNASGQPPRRRLSRGESLRVRPAKRRQHP
jgi:hypothetical protein